MTVAELRKALATYTPYSNLGSTSNPIAGFNAAYKILTEAGHGHRPGSDAFVFWLVKTNPINLASLTAFVNINIKTRSYVIVTAVGYEIDYRAIKPIATGKEYQFWVGQIIYLVNECT